MTYAIANVIYGLDLTADSELSGGDLRGKVEKILEEQDDPEDFDTFFEVYLDHDYSGNGPAPTWFGVELGEFDECTNMALSELDEYMNPSDKIKHQYQEKLAAIENEEIRKLFSEIEPKVLILWGSS